MIFSVSTLLLVSIVVATFLVYLPFLVVAYARFQVGNDPSAPRAMFDKLPPYAQRATWAHQNAFEVFTIYLAAALMAYVTGVDSPLAAGAVIAFLVARSFYPLFYILDLPIWRSLMFGIGSLSYLTLFGLSLLKVIAT